MHNMILLKSGKNGLKAHCCKDTTSRVTIEKSIGPVGAYIPIQVVIYELLCVQISTSHVLYNISPPLDFLSLYSVSCI